jgi:hypothetical protein
VFSRRGVGGWSAEDITTPDTAAGENGNGEYAFFSADLSEAIVDPLGDTLLSPEATEQTSYVRRQSLCEAKATASECYLPLVTANNVPPGTKFGSPKPAFSQGPNVLAVTPDLSHVIVQSKEVALTAHGAGGLYEWSEGRLQAIAPGATLGGNQDANTRNALSDDGSRVFFQQEIGNGHALYMSDTLTGQTVQMDAPAPGVSPPPASLATFEIASADGSKVFFLDEQPLTLDSKLKPVDPYISTPHINDLYVCQMVEEAGELKCDLTDLSVDPNAGEVANVRNAVVGASEDGSIVYFVATGKLAEGAEPGQDNLYVESETGSSWSAPRLVAVLSQEDSPDWDEVEDGGVNGFKEMQNLTSRVSSSGRYLAFMSDRSLTGYDNRDAVSGQPDEEVFLYDEATGGLRCVSCNATGARPDGVFDTEPRPLVDAPFVWEGRWLAASIPGWTEPENYIDDHASYESRVLSDEGRMFFNSPDALVPQGTNGKEDVYEYEPVGVGGCSALAQGYVAGEGGCVSLISSGTSSEESAFLDASEGGNDVFFLTAASLVARDVDSAFDVYDAHACSAASPCVSAPVPPPPCTSGDACKPAPSLQPAIFGAPSSATFSGLGDVARSEVAGSGSKPGAKKKKPAHAKRKSKHRRKTKGKSGPEGKSVRARGSLSAGTGR